MLHWGSCGHAPRNYLAPSNSYPRFILAKLSLVQFRIQSSLGQKFLMLALLDDSSLR